MKQSWNGNDGAYFDIEWSGTTVEMYDENDHAEITMDVDWQWTQVLIKIMNKNNFKLIIRFIFGKNDFQQNSANWPLDSSDTEQLGPKTWRFGLVDWLSNFGGNLDPRGVIQGRYEGDGIASPPSVIQIKLCKKEGTEMKLMIKSWSTVGLIFN